MSCRKRNIVSLISCSALIAVLLFSCNGSKIEEETDGSRLWSDKPAFTTVMEYQQELGGTSDIDDGLYEGDKRPELPRVKHPATEVKRWETGEGTDYLNEEVAAATNGRYTNPIRIWEGESYPIGNGRLAASVFNGSGRDRYVLNEVSYWSGGRNGGTINQMGDKSYNGEQGPDATQEEFGGAQPVGDLIIDFGSAVKRGTFHREINLRDGEVSSKGIRHGITIESKAFASYPDQVIVLQYKADQPGGLNALITMALQREQDSIHVQGQELQFHSSLKNGMKCGARMFLQPFGGKIKQGTDYLDLQQADSCTLILAIETNYKMDFASGWHGEDPQAKLNQRIEHIKDLRFADLERRHLADYHSLYNKVSLSLPPAADSLVIKPTYERLALYKASHDDNGLEETLFNFGRYLMISTSRAGSLPAGLQGIWNCMKEAPWGNDMHSNINFQMVYWLPEVANLPECHLAMLDYFYAMREPNRMATREYLQAIGKDTTNIDGWIVYTSHNPFGGHGWQVNLPGSAWYGLHMWEHFAFTQDTAYLRHEGYPMLRELSHYWMTHLKRLGKGGEGFVSNYQPVDRAKYPELETVEDGTLVVPLGWSPENGPRGEDGVAHDQEIVTELFRHTIEAAKILQTDTSFADSLTAICQHLYFPHIGKKGNLMEWMIDRNPETDHRHTSHLFAVFPGSTITLSQTPELAEAARKSLIFRKNTGDSRRSWAWTWRSMLWDRLRDGNKAHEMLEGLITYNMLDNLFTSHQIPLQIDGNYGIAASMIEMLVQSHDGMITLLPALPDRWPSGHIQGVKARGNITVSFSWENGKVTSWKFESPHPYLVTVCINGKKKYIMPNLL